MSKQKQVIGITGPSSFTKDVIHAVEDFMKATPLYIIQNKRGDIHKWVDMCSGIILAGGVDIHPRVYGLSVLSNYGFTSFDVERDLRELLVIEYALSKNIPILGICRGHQMLGVYHGLKMIPDLSDSVVCHNPNRANIKFTPDQPMHWVELTDLADDSFKVKEARSYELRNRPNARKFLWTNSFHHQGLDYKSRNECINVLGVAPGNHKNQKVIELMEGKGFISCQWHPEYDWDKLPASKMILTKFKNMVVSRNEIRS